MKKTIFITLLTVLILISANAVCAQNQNWINPYAHFVNYPQSEWEQYIFTDESYNRLRPTTIYPDNKGTKIPSGEEGRHGDDIAANKQNGQITIVVYYHTNCFYCQQLTNSISANKDAYANAKFIFVSTNPSETPTQIEPFFTSRNLDFSNIIGYYGVNYSATGALAVETVLTKYKEWREPEWGGKQVYNNTPIVLVFKGNGTSVDLRAITNGPFSYEENRKLLLNVMDALANEDPSRPLDDENSTPDPDPTNTPTATARPTNTATARPSNTPTARPTNTTQPAQPTNTATVRPTNTQPAQPTNTPAVRPTNTPAVNPTNTPGTQPTETQPVIPTNTPDPVIPTETPGPVVPTNTPIVPTNTGAPIIPTDTPVPTATPSQWIDPYIHYVNYNQNEWDKYLFTDESWAREESTTTLNDIFGEQYHGSQPNRYGDTIAQGKGNGHLTYVIYFDPDSAESNALADAIAANKGAYSDSTFIFVNTRSGETTESMDRFLGDRGLADNTMVGYYNTGDNGLNGVSVLSNLTKYRQLREPGWNGSQRFDDQPVVLVFKGNGNSVALRAITNGVNATMDNMNVLLNAQSALRGENPNRPLDDENRQPTPRPTSAAPQFYPFWDILDGIFGQSQVMPGTGIALNSQLRPRPRDLIYGGTGLELMIPTLDVMEQIVTVPEEAGEFQVEWLNRSIGLLDGSALPGEGIAVLAAHNHLNQKETGPFLYLNSLRAGDRLFIRNGQGQLSAYAVYENVKLSADNIPGIADYLKENALVMITCEDETPEGGYANRRLIFAEEL